MLTFTHKQDTASAIWTIDHNMNLTSVMIEVFNATNTPILPSKITKTSANQIVIVFSAARTGSVRLVGSTGVFVDYTGFVAPKQSAIDYTHSPQ